MPFERILPVGHEVDGYVKVWFPAISGGSGIDVLTRRLAVALGRCGVNAEISWFSTYYQFAPLLLSSVSPPPGVSLIHALSWNGFAFRRSEIPLLITEQLDVLDPVYSPYKNFAQSIFHQTLVRRFMNRSFDAASAVTAVSRATAGSLSERLGLKSVRVVYNSVDTRFFHPREKKIKQGCPFRLLFVGNLTKRKGADLLAPIMRQLGNRFELRYTTGLRDVRIRDVPSNMISIGKLTDDRELANAYHDCDALLFPSRLEGLAIAPLEAMACGKPVIAARASSMPEVVGDGVAGILCEPNSIDQFVQACRTLADDPQALQIYGEAARHRAETIFSEDTIIPQYISLYEALSSQKHD